MVFSGHTTSLFTLATDQTSYIIACVGAFITLGSFHYTIDIILAIFFTEL